MVVTQKLNTINT
ncbi:hypothetical protein FWK35_00014055 [Aphis craccivora]|uniref:Uncharacterized protein n=1 Tax=Aphis craccivora TaxID=307492 RepID=A0A6G0YY65_APHCR|nr:hypothetical protein FWK35_00014055 [Aphis craccivora]